MLEKVYSLHLSVEGIIREINVLQGPIIEAKERYDLVMCSSFKSDYLPTPNSLIGGLYRAGIDVGELAKSPEYGHSSIGFWFSHELAHYLTRRVCCVELLGYGERDKEANLAGIFEMLGCALGVDKAFHLHKIATVPLGTGTIGLSRELIIPLMLKMMLSSFRRNRELIQYDIYVYTLEQIEDFSRALSSLVSKPYDVFVSYPHAQSQFGIEVATSLKANNLKIWFDDFNLIGGEKFDKAITQGIDGSKLFLFLWFEETERSDYCKKELRQAKELDKRIIPYRNEKLRYVDPYFKEALASYNWLLSSKIDIQGLCLDLVSQIKEINARQDIIAIDK